MATKQGGHRYSNKAAVGHENWIAYLSTVDEVERKMLVNFLRRSDLSTKEGLAEFSAEVMMSVVEGRLPPGITSTLLEWAKFLFEILSDADGKSAIDQLNIAVVAGNAAPKRELPDYGVLDSITIPEKKKARVRAKEK